MDIFIHENCIGKIWQLGSVCKVFEFMLTEAIQGALIAFVGHGWWGHKEFYVRREISLLFGTISLKVLVIQSLLLTWSYNLRSNFILVNTSKFLSDVIGRSLNNLSIYTIAKGYYIMLLHNTL